MKHATTIAIFLFAVSSTATAFDFLGPPKSEFGKGQSGIGFEYLQSEINLESDGVFGLPDAEIKDIELNKYFGILQSGISPNVDVFIRLGLTNADVDQGSNNDNLGYFFGESDSEFTIGGGAKVTFLQVDTISLGLIGQISYVDLDFEGTNFGTILGQPVSLGAEAKLLDIELGVGPTLEISKQVCLYGGALFEFIDGQADITGTVGPFSATDSADLEEDSEFGGFVGGKIKLADTADLAVEYQSTGDSYAFGISLLHRFGEINK